MDAPTLQITLESKLFMLTIGFGAALLWGMGNNWGDSNIDILKTLEMLLVGAFVGAYAKGEGK
jgi:hypothetical protein